MDEYKAPYLILWSACSTALEAMEQQNFGLAKQLLIQAQQEAEEAFIQFEA